jgi:hypothetical protein
MQASHQVPYLWRHRHFQRYAAKEQKAHLLPVEESAVWHSRDDGSEEQDVDENGKDELVKRLLSEGAKPWWP